MTHIGRVLLVGGQPQIDGELDEALAVRVSGSAPLLCGLFEASPSLGFELGAPREQSTKGEALEWRGVSDRDPAELQLLQLRQCADGCELPHLGPGQGEES